MPRSAMGRRRRTLPARLMVIAGLCTCGYLAIISGVPWSSENSKEEEDTFKSRHLLAESNTTQKSEYPPPTFTDEQLSNGAVALYVIGVIYMFIALAIVCDEFFVPSLEVITETFNLSEDVAGATFMAAGGSAPELFTSFIGVFIAHSDVGIGTIVGSAVFNILFVIGMCAIISSQILALTWWPLFRDVSFYSVSLVCLIVFFNDNEITWWEALVLFVCYILYVIFMKFNVNVEAFVKGRLGNGNNRINSAQARSNDNLVSNGQPPQSQQPAQETRHTSSITCSMPILKSGSGKFRHGVLQLMIHTIDPIGESLVQEKAVKLHAIASLKVIVNTDNNNPEINEHGNGVKNGNAQPITNGVSAEETPRNQQTTITTVGSLADSDQQVNVISHTVTLGNGTATDPAQSTGALPSVSNSALPANDGAIEAVENGSAAEPDASVNAESDLDSSTPLDLSWPDTARKRMFYILVAPLVFLLWLTLPDVRRRDRRRFYPFSFLGSIIWIALFSYLMNWWAAVIGETAGIKDQVMGLTFLAAGTSIPDLITSVIVAKKGYGDMAISSSVGSNIFDVTVGLPVPWLLYGLIYNKPYTVDSDGLFCSILLLFFMLMLLIIMIAAFKWRMNKIMGVTYLIFYFTFLTLALLLEYGKIDCIFN